MKKYILLDSNIFISFFEGGFSFVQPNGEVISPEKIIILKNLLKALDVGSVNLILPEVVILECERNKEEKKRELERLYDSAQTEIEKAQIPPNKKISVSTRERINKALKGYCVQENNKVDRAWEIFKKILSHKNTYIIKLNQQIMLDVYKRGLMGKKPFKVKLLNSKNPEFNNKPVYDIQPDCIVIESAISFLRDKDNYEVYLGTNDSDFFTSNEKSDIHPDIKNDLHIKDCYKSLSELLDKVLGIKPPKKQKVDKEPTVDAYPIPTKSVTEIGRGEDDSKIVKGY